jgi:hypothetical protein
MSGTQLAAVIRALNERLGAAWAPERSLAGGWNEGAYVIVDPEGRRLVLKWTARNPERLLGALPVIAAGRAAGWPTAAWITALDLGHGLACCLQEFVPGQRPSRLDGDLVRQVIDMLEIQAGLRPDALVDWSDWVRGSVLDDWDDHRAPVEARFPLGGQIVAQANRVAASCADTELSTADLVHGNLGLDNLLQTPCGDLVAIDAQSVGRGTRVYDAVGVLLTAAGHSESTPLAEQLLLDYAQSVAGPRALALCMASTAISMAEAYLRTGHERDAPAAAPQILRLVTQCAEQVR